MRLHLGCDEVGRIAVNVDEALRHLAHELDLLRAVSHRARVDLVGSPKAFTSIGAAGIEYQIEVEVFSDNPRQPQADLRVAAIIDDGRLPYSIIPLTRGFIKTPSGDFLGG